MTNFGVKVGSKSAVSQNDEFIKMTNFPKCFFAEFHRFLALNNVALGSDESIGDMPHMIRNFLTKKGLESKL